MKIRSFRLQNYKCFRDVHEFALSDTLNIVIGQNNVGKTALLEALSLNFTGKPHRSRKSKPQPSSILNPLSIGEIRFSLSGEELREILLLGGDFHVPIPEQPSPYGDEGRKVVSALFENPHRIPSWLSGKRKRRGRMEANKISIPRSL